MPYISIKVNIEITKEKEKNLKAGLGKAIETIPGKSEAYLMLCFEDNQKMYFNGKNDKSMAFVEIKLLGKAAKESYNKMTGVVCTVLEEELGISPSMIYVKYEEVEHWGWNGGNF